MIIVGILTIVCTFLAVCVAAVSWFETHGDRGDRRAKEAAQYVANEAVAHITERVVALEGRTDAEARERDRLITKGMISETLHPLSENVARLDTKLSIMDDTLKALAADMVRILHQPDPARAHIDALLEAYTDGTLTPEERAELRKHLVTIRNWETGQPSPYPIHPGEQVAAAILLRVMDQEEKNRINGH